MSPWKRVFQRTRRLEPGTSIDAVQVAKKQARAATRPLSRRLDSHDEAIAGMLVNVEHLAHEVRAIEHRLEVISAAQEAPPLGSTQDIEESRNVLHLVRLEHERIRARLQLMTAYEERLRRIEEVIRHTHGGDLRGQGREPMS